jgi:hypothetical protein
MLASMRALLALGLALALAAASPATHVHAGAQGDEACAVCLARSGDAATSATPDVAPRVVPVGTPACARGRPPVAGAPLGAIPGQSPPTA